MSKKEWAIIGILGTVVVVVFACLGCLILVMLTAPPRPTGQVAISNLPSVIPEQLPTQSSATQVKPTTLPQPTSTPKPTETLTSTRIPTPTVVPTRTPTVNAAEQSYRQAAGKIMTTYSLVSNQLSDAMDRASNNPTLLLDKDWKVEVAWTMALVKQNGIDLRKLKPPARYASLHADLVEMSTHFDKAMDCYAKAFDTFDADTGTQGNNEIQLALKAMKMAQQKLDALQ